jgi:flagellar hook-basal body complex protein FliE
MTINPVSLSGVAPPPTHHPAPKAPAGGASFPDMLHGLLQNAAQSHAGAEAAVRDMALGQTDNLHGVMLQMAQADLSFRLILEIRNRLTDAYQEIMKMQM